MHNALGSFHQRLSRGAPPLIDAAKLMGEVIDNIDHFSPTWHALGFVHCTLHSMSAGTLRLHIWPENTRSESEQRDKIHDHLFSLRSMILTGEVTNRLYRLDPPEIALSTHRMFEVLYQENRSELVATNNFFAPVVYAQSCHLKGDCYTVGSGEFHDSSVCPTRFTATLVATYEHTQMAPRMLGKLDSPPSPTRKKVDFSLAEWKVMLGRVLEDIVREPIS